MTFRATMGLHLTRRRYGRISWLLTSRVLPTMVDKKETPTDGAIGLIAKKLAMSRNLISWNIGEPRFIADLNDEESRKRQKREEEEEKAEFERSWRRTKLGLIAFGMGGLLLSFWAKYFFGQPTLDEQGIEADDEFSELPPLQQNIGQKWRQTNCMHPMCSRHISTLVLVVKDVLIHPEWTYKTGWRFKKRPGVDLFLRECAKHFEIVVYTTEQGVTVFPLLDALDPNGYIMYRLVRDSTHFVDGHHIKNLDNLNRDLKHVVVVDWDKNSKKMHPRNTFSIPRWLRKDDDTTLFGLVSFLSVLGIRETEDVREPLHYYSQFEDPVAKFRENQQRLIDEMFAEELGKVKQTTAAGQKLDSPVSQ